MRLYSFLSQVMPWTDRELETRYTFGRFLLKRPPRSFENFALATKDKIEGLMIEDLRRTGS